MPKIIYFLFFYITICSSNGYAQVLYVPRHTRVNIVFLKGNLAFAMYCVDKSDQCGRHWEKLQKALILDGFKQIENSAEAVGQIVISQKQIIIMSNSGTKMLDLDISPVEIIEFINKKSKKEKEKEISDETDEKN
jgi:hypothetical protein